jgi:diguanylate cyclase (GGDEF)-like protein
MRTRAGATPRAPPDDAPGERIQALETEVLYRDLVLNSLAQGICLYGPDAVVRLANPRYSELLGVDPALPRPGTTMRALLAASIAAGHHGERSLETLETACLALVARGKPQQMVLTLGSGRLVSFNHVPLPDGGWLAIFDDITERKRLEEEAAFLARHDRLTRLPNRMMLAERLEATIGAAGRGTRFALLWVNLDHFKSVNDTLGHGVGDRLLQVAAERLGGCVRDTDFLARLGGDEFAIIQCAIAGAEDAGRLAQRLVAAIGGPFELDAHQIQISTSIGIAIGPDDGLLAETLLHRADAAMERARQDGGGTYRLFEPEMDARLQARRAMEADLRGALAADAFEVHYQPLVDVRTTRVTGFEALLRWRRPDGTMVPPSVFIPLAEEIGLISEIGDWVLRAACHEAASWPDPLRVAVNVSPMQFKGGRLPQVVAAALAAAGLAASRLELEITESVLLHDNAATMAVLRGLRGLGSRIAMDDFGTGYSSLSYLRSFPFDKIKIDQSFVRDLEAPADSAVIVGAMVGLGRSLGMRVTAEGVETPTQLSRLHAAGCDEVQGYLFGRPSPARDVPGVIARINAGGLLPAAAGGRGVIRMPVVKPLVS